MAEVEKIAANRYRLRAHDHVFTVDAQDLLELDGLWAALGEDVGAGSKARADGKAGASAAAASRARRNLPLRALWPAPSPGPALPDKNHAIIGKWRVREIGRSQPYPKRSS